MAQTVALSQRLGGTNFCTIDGVTYLLMEGSWRCSTPTRETQKGQSGVFGYTEKPNSGQIKVKLQDYASNSVTNIGNITSSNIVLSLANGKTVNGQNMWSTEPPEVSLEDGTFECTFESGSVTEQ